MDEEALQLSEVYTEMEMEEYKGRGRKKTIIPLIDYKDLFKHVQPQGTRILVKGDPGIGKTTFVQKLAFDWATNHLVMFDVVLVVRLKFADKTQSIARMVKDQIGTLCEDDTISEKDIAEYMRSGRDRVLLVLDGLDEIKLKQYPQVQEVLVGERYRKCCILATTRPYVAATLYNKMTTVAKIKGYSREQAKQFVGNILNGDELVEFLRQLDKRKISQMQQVPLIVKALALIFKEYQKLPRTYTFTYDELVLFLRKSCKQSKDLTEDELQAAMDEVSELAFKGLIREDKQLVFSRDEIKDDNVRKLGILTAENAGSGFRPTEVLQFTHKTVQEHSASDHVVKRLLSDDRGPWETLVEQFHKDASTKDQQQTDRQRRRNPAIKEPNLGETERKPDAEQITVKSVLEKFTRTALSRPDFVGDGKEFFERLLEAGAFEEVVDFTRVSDALKSDPFLKEVLNEKERDIFIHYLVKDNLMEAGEEFRSKEKSVVKKLLMRSEQDPNTLKQYIMDVKELLTWLAKNPEMGTRSLLQLASFYKLSRSNPDREIDFRHRHTYEVISLEFTDLLERVEQSKTLFRFIIGRLADHPTIRETILQEMAVLVIQHSFDPDTGGVLSMQEMVSYVSDLKSEFLSDDENTVESDPFLVTPVLSHFRSTMSFSKVGNLEPNTPCALKVLGREANIQQFIPRVINEIRHLRNIQVAELEWLNCLDSDEDVSCLYQEFTTVICRSPQLVSMQLIDLDPKFMKIVTQNLPLSLKRLLMVSDEEMRSVRGTYTFPPEVHLVTLQLQNCLSSVGDLFRNTTFTNLKKISIKSHSYKWEDKEPLRWTREDAQSLLDAVRAGRMPTLQELVLRDCCLRNCGRELVEILKFESFCSAQFIGAELSKEDGQILLKSIQDGNLNHMEFLNLLNNEEISFMRKDFGIACDQHDITLEMNLPQSDFMEECTEENAVSPVSNLDSIFTPERAKTMELLMSSFTTEQIQSAMTLFFSVTPNQKNALKILLSSLTAEQKQTVKILLSILTPEQAQTLSKVIANFVQNESRSRLQQETTENMDAKPSQEDTENNIASSLATPVYGFIKDQMRKDTTDAMKIILSSLNPEETLNITTLLSSLTPEQVRTIKTLITSFTPEQVQTTNDFISSLTLEQLEIAKTLISGDKQNQSSSGEQLEHQAEDVAVPQSMDNLGTMFCNVESSANENEVQGMRESNQENVGKSDRKQKHGNYTDNLDKEEPENDVGETMMNQPRSRVQGPETPSAHQLFDFSAIRGDVSRFFNRDNSEPQTTEENFQLDGRLFQGEGEGNDYAEDLDLD